MMTINLNKQLREREMNRVEDMVCIALEHQPATKERITHFTKELMIIVNDNNVRCEIDYLLTDADFKEILERVINRLGISITSV